MVGTITFGPSCLGQNTSNLPISHIVIGALAPTPAACSGRAKQLTSASALTNRWVIHFVQDSQRSIRLTPSLVGPDAAGLEIAITFDQYDAGMPSDLVCTCSLATIPGLLFGTVDEVMVRGRFQSYRFDPSGHGVRYWMSLLLSFLKENGRITSAAELSNARACLQQVWLRDGRLADEDQQTHAVPGCFYDDETD